MTRKLWFFVHLLIVFTKGYKQSLKRKQESIQEQCKKLIELAVRSLHVESSGMILLSLSLLCSTPHYASDTAASQRQHEGLLNEARALSFRTCP